MLVLYIFVVVLYSSSSSASSMRLETFLVPQHLDVLPDMEYVWLGFLEQDRAFFQMKTDV
jgi:hypothetical protein